MQKFIEFWRNWVNRGITICDITIQISQWIGPTTGISVRHKQYSLSLFCSVLMSYRIRNYPTEFKKSIRDLMFSIKRNTRMVLLIWHTDITILGFTIQIEKYKPEFI